MNLYEYYHALSRAISPRKQFVELVANECGVIDITVYRWISGDFIPDKLKCERLSLITGIPIAELFSHIKEKQTGSV